MEIWNHLIKYMNRYASAVKYVSKTFLLGKGQTLEDYTEFMSVPGNWGDEHSLYLCARKC